MSAPNDDFIDCSFAYSGADFEDMSSIYWLQQIYMRPREPSHVTIESQYICFCSKRNIFSKDN